MQRYVEILPRRNRESHHPKTPNKFRKCSRRKFDGLIKKWRKLLHVWDENPEALKDFKYLIKMFLEKKIIYNFNKGILMILRMKKTTSVDVVAYHTILTITTLLTTMKMIVFM